MATELDAPSVVEKQQPGYKLGGYTGKGFMPGQSGNPGGLLKGSISLVSKLKQYLREHPEEADAVIHRLVQEGKLGNMVATKEMLERIDGKVAETHKIEVAPVRLVFLPASELLQMSPEPLTAITEGTEEESDG